MVCLAKFHDYPDARIRRARVASGGFSRSLSLLDDQATDNLAKELAVDRFPSGPLERVRLSALNNGVARHRATPCRFRLHFVAPRHA
jgi:hypothetical protein